MPKEKNKKEDEKKRRRDIFAIRLRADMPMNEVVSVSRERKVIK